MAQTFLIFDFDSEDAAQQARLLVERWKQGFRLGNKVSLKFDRAETPAEDGEKMAPEGEKSKATASKGKKAAAAADEKVVLVLRLDFSDHEKLSSQRWLDRIPSEAAFKSAPLKIIQRGDKDFEATAERFEGME